MSVNNPQHKDLITSKKFSTVQDICGILAFMLAIFQGVTMCIPSKAFLGLTGMILVVEYASSHFKSLYFDNGHRLREIGLIDNSFNEKRIPNYNSEQYYTNGSISTEEIKLLANIHENAFFTSHITEKMSVPYYIFSVVSFLFFMSKLFMSGMDDYSSILLSFIVSSSFFDRVIRLNSLKKSSKDVYDKANEICNFYEKTPAKTNILLPKILELLLLYENAVFESKIILSDRVFEKVNDSLSMEWQGIRDGYSIYKIQEEMEN